MSEDSLEFQPMPGINSENDRVRNSFRVPVSHKDNIQVVFYEEPYTIINISNTGVAVHTDTCLKFEIGQIIEDAALIWDDQHIEGLVAKVIHCSIQDSGELQYGLAWIDLSDDDKSKLNDVNAKIKSRYLDEE